MWLTSPSTTCALGYLRRIARRGSAMSPGGSGTRAVLVDAAGRLLASGHSGASGTVGGIASRRALQHALSDALAPLVAVAQSSACTLHLGMRGLSVRGRREAALDTLQRCLPGARV